MILNLTVLPGDGIGPEVTAQAVAVLQAVSSRFGHQLQLQEKLRLQMEAEPVQFLWRRYEERLEPAREIVARFIGARQCSLRR